MNPKADRPAFRAPTAGNPDDPQGFHRAVVAYLESLAVRGLRPSSLDDRSRSLDYFVDWAEERGLTRPADITRPILERYQRHIFYFRKPNGRPLSFSYQRERVACLRGLFGYLARRNQILYNPASDLELPRLRAHLPAAVLTVADFEQLLTLPDVTDVYGLRDRALLETLYSTAMRRSELAYLKLPDVDFTRGTVFIRCGKGGKDRVVPIGERAIAWIERYLSESRPLLVVPPDEGFLFLTYLGQTFDPDHLSYLVARLIQKAELGKSGSCHLLRHSVATLMLEAGADCRYVQEMLGHANLSTTQIYLQVAINKLKEVHSKTHPGAALKPATLTAGPCRPIEPCSAGARRALMAALDEERESDGPAPKDPGGPI